MNKIENGILRGTMEAFIIPNPACPVDNWLSETTRKEMTENATSLCEMNGCTFDPQKDALVEL